MPKLARENLYPGINAHLQNLLPMRDSASFSLFPAFHSDHITFLTASLNAILPDPYTASTETSLQIRTLDFVYGDNKVVYPIPDSAIFHDRQVAPTAPETTLSPLATPFLEMEFDINLLEPDHIMRSVVVYTHEALGQPVTRIELLSPSNKWGGSGHELYMKNRSLALLSGTNLIEIDYFHSTPTPLSQLLKLPSYPAESSFPYNITVSIPRQKVKTRLYGIPVDESLPTQLPIPLLEEEFVALNLQAVYNQTFIGGKCGRRVDYETPLAPIHLQTYRSDDQIRLEELRQHILTANSNA